MKHATLIFSCLLALSAAGCSQSGGNGSLLSEEARDKAVNAAQALLDCDSTNIMQLQDRLMNASSIRSEYLLIGDTAAADTFDTVFKQYVKVRNKSLAKEIFN